MAFARGPKGWSSPETPPKQWHQRLPLVISPSKHERDRQGFKRRRLDWHGNYTGFVPEERRVPNAYGEDGFTAKGLRRESCKSICLALLAYEPEPESSTVFGPCRKVDSEQWLKSQLRHYDVELYRSSTTPELRELLKQAVVAGKVSSFLKTSERTLIIGTV